MSGEPANTTISVPGPASPVAELMSVALPAVITMTSYTLMQFVDNLIVKELGPGAISAVGNGGIAAFIPGAAAMGLLSVVNTFVAQNYGAGTVRNGAGYVWNGLYLNLILWLLIFVPLGLNLEHLFLFSYAAFGVEAPGEQLLDMQVTYGGICMLGMITTLCARTVGHFFYGVHRPAIVMISAIAGNLVNLTLCSLWVLGGIGLPGLFWWDAGIDSMGVTGAAVSTVIGGFVELLLPMALFLSPKFHERYATRAGWRPSWARMKGLLRLGWPAGLMQGNELLGFYVFMVVLVGAFNIAGQPPVHTDAGWIVLRYMHLSFMPAVGLSIALTSIVGKYVGAGDERTAVRRTWLGLALTTGYMSLCAGAFVLFRGELVGLFIDDDVAPAVAGEVLRLGSAMLIVAAAFQFFDAIAISLVGALRGAGDTVWPGVVTVVLTWCVLIGFGWLTVLYLPQWGSLGPWVGAAAYIFLLAVAFLWRFLSGGWKGHAVAGRGAEVRNVEFELGLIPGATDHGMPDPETPQRAGGTSREDDAGRA